MSFRDVVSGATCTASGGGGGSTSAAAASRLAAAPAAGASANPLSALSRSLLGGALPAAAAGSAAAAAAAATTATTVVGSSSARPRDADAAAALPPTAEAAWSAAAAVSPTAAGVSAPAARPEGATPRGASSTGATAPVSRLESLESWRRGAVVGAPSPSAWHAGRGVEGVGGGGELFASRWAAAAADASAAVADPAPVAVADPSPAVSVPVGTSVPPMAGRPPPPPPMWAAPPLASIAPPPSFYAAPPPPWLLAPPSMTMKVGAPVAAPPPPGGSWAAEFSAATAAPAVSVAPVVEAGARSAVPSADADGGVDALVDTFQRLQAGGDALAAAATNPSATAGVPPASADVASLAASSATTADTAAAADVVASLGGDWADHFTGLDAATGWADAWASTAAATAGADDAATAAAAWSATGDAYATAGPTLDAYCFVPAADTAQTATAAATSAAAPAAEELLARGEAALAARAHGPAIRWLEAAVRVEGVGALPPARSAAGWLLLGRAHAECDADANAIAALQRCLLAVNKAVEAAAAVRGGAEERDAAAAVATRQEALLALGVSCTNELDAARATAYLSQWLDTHPVYGATAGGGSSTAPAPPLATEAAEASSPAATLFTATTGMAPLTDAPALLRRYGDLVATFPAAAADVSVHVITGVLHNLLADYPAASAALRTAVELSPTDARLWNKLGATLANGGAGRDALRAYRKAVDLDARFIRAWVNVGTAYANEGDGVAAVRYYTKALSLLHAKERSGGGEVGVDGVADPVSWDTGGEAPHVWQYLRTNLILAQREDLLPYVDAGDVDAIRQHVRVP